MTVPPSYVAASAVVRVDGVDLIAALGLTPPFDGASGSVMIGGAPVSVSSFRYGISPSGVEVSARLEGLPIGDHAFDARAQQTGAGPTVATVAFSVVGAFSLEEQALASAGAPPPPPVATAGNHAGNATLGEPLAAPPVAISGGGQLRAGFVPVARGRAGPP